MGLNDFTGGGSDDDDDTTGGGSGSGIIPVFPGGPGRPGGPGSSGQDDDEEAEMLALLTIDLNVKYANHPPALFREGLIQQLLATLIGKHKSNALLTGSAGVGKSQIAQELARRIATGHPLIPDQLKNFTVLELPLSNLVAGSSYVGQLEEKVKWIVEYAMRHDVILFIDEIHQLTSAGEGSTYGKIAQILKPAMSRGELKIIGATTSQESRSLDRDPALKRRFTRLIVDELTVEQTEIVLQSLVPSLIEHYRYVVSVDLNLIPLLVRVADQNSGQGSHRPDNAITLLDRTMAERVLVHNRAITTAKEDGNAMLAQAMQGMKNLSITEEQVRQVALKLMTGNAVKHQLDIALLRNTLHSKVKGQNSVIDEIVDRITREELAVFPRRTPIAWMFAGASGVGKTEASKIIAEMVTAQEPIILNMTEYEHPSSISRIIGAPPGYVGSDSNTELPFDSLESNPHRLILLDEFEKAHTSVQRLFMQALDEGFITSSQNKRLDFSKALVVATTNAGREALDGHQMGFGSTNQKVAPLNARSLASVLNKTFDAELLGRFSYVVGFNPIGEDLFGEIVQSTYELERERILGDHPLHATTLPTIIPADEIEQIITQSYVPSQGARPAVRAVRTWIENTLLAALSGPAGLTDSADDEVLLEDASDVVTPSGGSDSGF